MQKRRGSGLAFSFVLLRPATHVFHPSPQEEDLLHQDYPDRSRTARTEGHGFSQATKSHQIKQGADFSPRPYNLPMKTFSARETVWLQELDGIELAGFNRRALALTIDGILAFLLLSLCLSLGALAYFGISRLTGHHPTFSDVSSISTAAEKAADADEHSDDPQKHKTYYTFTDSEIHHTILGDAINLFTDIVLPVLYFGIFLWQGNGRTPGKRLMKIRVVSLVHTRISFWHAVERALGYGAAALEGGFGFIQYFIHPYRRCAQDRLAETIVVTERSYQQKFPPTQPTPPESETAPPIDLHPVTPPTSTTNSPR
jgi:uncharacterized RDD family membrane protein YckC